MRKCFSKGHILLVNILPRAHFTKMAEFGIEMAEFGIEMIKFGMNFLPPMPPLKMAVGAEKKAVGAIAPALCP